MIVVENGVPRKATASEEMEYQEKKILFQQNLYKQNSDRIAELEAKLKALEILAGQEG